MNLHCRVLWEVDVLTLLLAEVVYVQVSLQLGRKCSRGVGTGPADQAAAGPII